MKKKVSQISINIFEHIEHFLNYLKYNRNYSDLTIKAYKEDLNRFVLLVKEVGLSLKVKHIDLGIIRQCIKKLLEEGKSKNTIRRFISCLKSFFNYLKRNEIIEQDILRDLFSFKKEKNVPIFAYRKEIISLIEKIPYNNGNYLEDRNRLIFEILYGLGLRISELSLISLEDLRLHINASVKVLGKRKKRRLLPLTKRLVDYLSEYLEIRGSFLEEKKKKNEWLLLNRFGERISVRSIREVVRKTIKQLSLSIKLYPHAMRHSLATHLLENGIDIRILQEILGHSSISSTEVYTHITKETIRKKYEAFHPFVNRGNKESKK